MWLQQSLSDLGYLVSIVTRLHAGQCGVKIWVHARDFTLLQNVLIGSGAHLASYSLGTGAQIDHSPPTSTEVKTERSCT